MNIYLTADNANTDGEWLELPDKAVEAARAWLLAVPGELKRYYDEISENEILDQLSRTGRQIGGESQSLNIGYRIAHQEIGRPERPTTLLGASGSLNGPNRQESALYQTQLEKVEHRARAIARVVTLRGFDRVVQVHDERLQRAVAQNEQAKRALSDLAYDRDRNTDPVSAVYDTDLHGSVRGGSIMPGRFVPSDGGAWHDLHASDLSHHLVSVLFALRMLECDPQLASSVEARVQQMLITAGVSATPSPPARKKTWPRV